jgi:hypothetical protein
VDPTKKSKDAAGPCPKCEHPENPPENRFCGLCGAPLERAPARRSTELALRARERGATLKERFLPARLGPVAKTAAASLAIVAADVGLAWLRHRLEKPGGQALPRDAGHAWQEERSEGAPEYLHGYSLNETALLFREGQETRRSYYSELTITSSRIEK